MTGLGGDRSRVTLSDGVVELRPWTRSDATFLAEASRDQAIERYNGPSPNSLADAVAVIDSFERSWRTFAISGDPTGVAFAISGTIVPQQYIDIRRYSATVIASTFIY